MAKQIVKYAENACEYETMKMLAEELQAEGVSLRTDISFFSNLFANYCQSIPNLSPAQRKSFQDEIAKRSPLCEQAAKKMSASLLQMYDRSSYSYDIIPMNKAGLSQGVSQKSDININIYKGEVLVDVKEVSLKLYIGKNKKGSMMTQVASGTYLSTLCGLGFDVTGRGTFATPSGSKFISKKSNIDLIKKHFASHYGSATAEHINEILSVTNRTHELRTESRKPSNIDSIRKSIGTSAINPFISLLTEVNKSGDLKSRILKRSGLRHVATKEIVAACFTDKGEVQVFSSIGNEKFHKNIQKLNAPDSKLEFVKKGQGLEFRFLDERGSVVLKCSMPLTININGAWANRYRYDKLDDCYYEAGQLRKTKAKQLDTSTNVWLDLGQIF